MSKASHEVTTYTPGTYSLKSQAVLCLFCRFPRSTQGTGPFVPTGHLLINQYVKNKKTCNADQADKNVLHNMTTKGGQTKSTLLRKFMYLNVQGRFAKPSNGTRLYIIGVQNKLEWWKACFQSGIQRIGDGKMPSQ